MKIEERFDKDLVLGDRVLITAEVYWLKKETQGGIPFIGLTLEGNPGYVTRLPEFHGYRKQFLSETGQEWTRLENRSIWLGDRFDFLGTICEVAEELSSIDLYLTGTPGTWVNEGSKAGAPGSSMDWVIQSKIQIGSAGFARVNARQTELGVCKAKSITEIRTPVNGWTGVINETETARGRVKARALALGAKVGIHRSQPWRVVTDLARAEGVIVGSEVKLSP